MLVFLYLNEISARFEVGNYCLSCLESVHSCILGIIVDNLSVVGHDVYDRQIVANAYFKIVGVVSRGYLNNACSELHVNVGVGDNGYLPANKRQSYCLANIFLISFVLGIYCNGGIAQKCFGTGGCKL